MLYKKKEKMAFFNKKLYLLFRKLTKYRKKTRLYAYYVINMASFTTSYFVYLQKDFREIIRSKRWLFFQSLILFVHVSKIIVSSTKALSPPNNSDENYHLLYRDGWPKYEYNSLGYVDY